MGDVIGWSSGIDSKATLYVSFVQSYVEPNKSVFNYKTLPVAIKKGGEVKHKNKEVKIPKDCNKDVYYWDYPNRKELFLDTEKEFNGIPVYFPIPVLRNEKQYSVIFHTLSIRKKILLFST
ncbi:hypothetical protein QTN25_004884 [Entamoeba marina]